MCRYILISCFASVGLNSQGQPPLPAVVLPPAAIPAPPKPETKALPRIEIERPVPESPGDVRTATQRVETNRVPYRERDMAVTVVAVPGAETGNVDVTVFNLSGESIEVVVGDRTVNVPKRSRQTVSVAGPVTWSLGTNAPRPVAFPAGTSGLEIYLNR